MSDIIRVRRGDRAQLPPLAQGEFGFCRDTEELFIGGKNGNRRVLYPSATSCINVLDFYGTPETTDTAAFTAMINYANLYKRNMYIPNRTYVITADLPKVASGLYIIGESVSDIDGAGVCIKDYRTTSTFLIEIERVGVGGGMVNIRFDCQVTDTQYSPKCIYNAHKSNGWDFTLENIIINNYLGCGYKTVASDTFGTKMKINGCGSRVYKLVPEYAFELLGNANFYSHIHIEHCRYPLKVGAGIIDCFSNYFTNSKIEMSMAGMSTEMSAPILIQSNHVYTPITFDDCMFVNIPMLGYHNASIHNLTYLPHMIDCSSIAANSNKTFFPEVVIHDCRFLQGNGSSIYSTPKILNNNGIEVVMPTDCLWVKSTCPIRITECDFSKLTSNGYGIDINQGIFNDNWVWLKCNDLSIYPTYAELNNPIKQGIYVGEAMCKDNKIHFEDGTLPWHKPFTRDTQSGSFTVGELFNDIQTETSNRFVNLVDRAVKVGQTSLENQTKFIELCKIIKPSTFAGAAELIFEVADLWKGEFSSTYHVWVKWSDASPKTFSEVKIEKMYSTGKNVDTYIKAVANCNLEAADNDGSISFYFEVPAGNVFSLESLVYMKIKEYNAGSYANVGIFRTVKVDATIAGTTYTVEGV